jgi:hypothetical protein
MGPRVPEADRVDGTRTGTAVDGAPILDHPETSAPSQAERRPAAKLGAATAGCGRSRAASAHLGRPARMGACLSSRVRTSEVQGQSLGRLGPSRQLHGCKSRSSDHCSAVGTCTLAADVWQAKHSHGTREALCGTVSAPGVHRL